MNEATNVALVTVLTQVGTEINTNAHTKGFYPVQCSLCEGKGYKESGVEDWEGFYEEFNEYCSACKGSGWAEGKLPRTAGESCALLHSEISEAFEGYRHHNPPSEHIPEYSAAEEEFADLFIRLMDEFVERRLRFSAIKAKMDFNSSRPYRHGNKAC